LELGWALVRTSLAHSLSAQSGNGSTVEVSSQRSGHTRRGLNRKLNIC